MKHTNEACSEFEQHLSLYVGGDLDADVIEGIERHLEGCAACREQEHQARTARDLLLSTLRVTERRGPDLWSGVRQGLITEGLLRPAAPAPAPVATPRVSRRPRPLVFVASAAAAVLVGFWLGNTLLHEPKTGVDVDRGAPSPEILVDHRTPVEPKLVTPVSDTGGLRRLAPGETPMSDEASMYTGFWDDRSALQGGGSVVAPASLRNVRGTH